MTRDDIGLKYVPDQPRLFLRALLDAAIESGRPDHCVPPNLPDPPRGRTIVVGAGKAAASMARAVEASWKGGLEGLVITRSGHGAACRRIEVVEAAHPIPDEAGLRASARVCELVQGLCADDLVICLISGGGSALLVQPAGPITLADKQAVTGALLRSGAPIREINCVRKHLSRVKGGRLAVLARPARVVTLAISDIPGDDPALIASGPTVPDSTTRHDAIEILSRWNIAAPESVSAWLHDEASETPKGALDWQPDTRIIAAPAMALDAAACLAHAAGVHVINLGDGVEGEARDVAAHHASLALRLAGQGIGSSQPCLLLSGGETTVTVRGSGRGGRNSEYALALAVHLGGAPGIHAIAADTDGIDGVEDNAGAVVTPHTLADAAQRGRDAAACLRNNDSRSFFEAAGSLVMTGPTLTNLNDFRAILIDRRNPGSNSE